MSLLEKNQNRGWGLPFAKQVIEKHFKGKLDIISIFERGTRVTILLPAQIRKQPLDLPA